MWEAMEVTKPFSLTQDTRTTSIDPALAPNMALYIQGCKARFMEL